MHYRADCDQFDHPCTEGILIGSLLAELLQGQGLPPDLEAEARASKYYSAVTCGLPDSELLTSGLRVLPNCLQTPPTEIPAPAVTIPTATPAATATPTATATAAATMTLTATPTQTLTLTPTSTATPVATILLEAESGTGDGFGLEIDWIKLTHV